MKTTIGITFFCVLCFSFFSSCSPNEKENSNASDSQFTLKIDSIVSLMTLKEKIGQLNQYSIGQEMTGPNQTNEYSKKRYNQLINGQVGSVLNLTGAENTILVQKQVMENSRLKIPLLFAYDVIHGYKTIFPIPLAESCSWDLLLMESTARAAAQEAAASGLHWTFAPMVDVSRDPRWGRVMEGAGEDPYLGAQIAAARIRGFQGDNLKDTLTIAACAKHFAGYGFVESGKDYNTVNIGQNTLMNVVIPPFEMAAKTNVATFMNAFNDLDGIPATANQFLLNELLSKTWNYKGAVVSDWGSIREMVNHRYTPNLKNAAKQAILSGTDIDMESQAYINWLEQIADEEPSIIKNIDKAVKKVLLLKYKLGLFDDPYKYSNENREKNTVESPAIQALAKQAALKSMVLLKNENSLLPIPLNKKIGLIGPLADDSDAPIGNWRARANANSAISLLDGLNQAFGASNVAFEQGCKLSIGENNFHEELKINESDTSGFMDAIDLAKRCDIVVMALGETAYMSGEGRSRSKIGLPGLQLKLLKEVFKVNKNVVLVLMNGRPLTIPWEAQNIPAILEAWHGGSKAGAAIADILVGNYNPSGKLTMSFPKNVGQIPIYYNKKNTGRPSSGPNQVFYTHHTDVDNEPLYHFGYGLSYTTFKYSKLRISKKELRLSDTLSVSIEITNTGKYKGKEVVQLYITDEFASVTPPLLALKDFVSVELNPGEKAEVTFDVSREHLSFYNQQNKWITEPGSFEVSVGGSSNDCLKTNFTLLN